MGSMEERPTLRMALLQRLTPSSFAPATNTPTPSSARISVSSPATSCTLPTCTRASYGPRGNGKLLYVSSQDNYYTFTMFDAQAMWAVKLIQGEISLPFQEEQEAEWKSWDDKFQKVNGCH